MEVHHKQLNKILVVGQQVRIRGTTNFNGPQVVTYVQSSSIFCFDQQLNNAGEKLNEESPGEGRDDLRSKDEIAKGLIAHPLAAFSVGRVSNKKGETAKVTPEVAETPVKDIESSEETGKDTPRSEPVNSAPVSEQPEPVAEPAPEHVPVAIGVDDDEVKPTDDTEQLL